MKPIDLLIEARWIVPVEPAATVLEHHSLAVDEGRIRALLPSAEARERFRPSEVISRPRHAILPGLINAHTHAPMTLLRGLADDLPLERWLHEHIWPAERRWVSRSFVRDGTELAMAEMLRGGVTCFNDMYFFPDVGARIAAERGMRANIGLIVLETPSAWAQDAGEYLHKGLALRDDYKDHPLVSCCFAPHAPYSVSDASLTRVGALSDQLETPVHIHLHETAAEVSASVDAAGVRPMARLAQLGLLGPGLQAVHMTQLFDQEIDEAARFGVNVIHCPESNLKLASGLCPVAKLIDAGVNVALGTDGAGSNNDLDMFGEMRMAALLAKGVAGDATAVRASQALGMATINGARALGLSAHTGSLVTGKWADLCCVDLSAPATQPVYDVISQIVYAAGRDQVCDVWVAGRQLLDSRELTRIDESALMERVAQWQARIGARTQ